MFAIAIRVYIIIKRNSNFYSDELEKCVLLLKLHLTMLRVLETWVLVSRCLETQCTQSSFWSWYLWGLVLVLVLVLVF